MSDKRQAQPKPWTLARLYAECHLAPTAWLALVEMAERRGSSIVTPTREDLRAATGARTLKLVSAALTALSRARWIIRNHVPLFTGAQQTATALRIKLCFRRLQWVLPFKTKKVSPDGNSPKRAQSFFKMTIEFLYSRLNSDNFRAFPVRFWRKPPIRTVATRSANPGANAGRFSSRSNDRCRFWPMPTPTRAPDVHLAAAVQSTLTRRAGFGMIAALMNGERFKQASQSAHPRTYEPPNISRGIPRGTSRFRQRISRLVFGRSMGANHLD